MNRLGGRGTPSFGDLLRGHRGARGLTQEELAERSGLSVDAVSLLERGLRTAPRSGTVEALAQALGLDASERDALAIAARASRRPPAARTSVPMPSTLHSRAWAHRARRIAAGLAGLLAALAIATLGDAPLGAADAHTAVPSLAPPEPLPEGPSAVVYANAGDPTVLRQVDYRGSPMAGTWSTTRGPVLYSGDPTQQVVGISPDGEDAVTLGAFRRDYRIVDTLGQLVATVLSTMESTDFGAWANDSRHICRMGIVDQRWQLTITDVLAPYSPPTVVQVDGLTDPPYVTIAACDPTPGRVVLVEPMSDTVPAPPDAARRALLVDLSTGRIVTRVPIGDTTHGAVFSLDGRYLATIDYQHGTSSIVSLLSGKTVWTDRNEVRAFSADDSRVVENSRFEPLGEAPDTTRVVDWATGRVLYSTSGHTTKVSVQPSGAALALNVVRTAPDAPADLVIVPAARIGIVLPGAVLF